MDNNTVIVSLAGSVSAIVICLLILVRTLIDSKKNGNGNNKAIQQSQDCFKQHQEICGEIKDIKGELKDVKKDMSVLQKTLDERQPIFRALEDKLNSLTLQVNRWDGTDRRKP